MIMPEEDCSLHEPSGRPTEKSSTGSKDDQSYYESALAAKLAAEDAAEDDRVEDGNTPTPSPPPELSAANVPWYKQKCRVISIAVVLAMVVAVAVVVPLALIQDGDKNDAVNSGAPEEPTSRKNPEREAAIAARLVLVTPGGNETLMEPSTPQYRALQWLVYDDEMELDPAADHLQQRYLLMVIHFPSTKYASVDSRQWGSAVHECEWDEVQCEDKMNLMYEYGQDGVAWTDDTPQRIVTGLTLRQRLGGQIHEELSLLSFLQYLDLENNKLVGSLPSHIYELHKLKTLFLSQNQLSNVDDIGEFKHLEHLSLSMNNFKGPLPASFESLKHLKTLDLHTNEFTGDLFQVINDFESLETIDVAFNDFSGTLSPLIGNMTNLTTILLGNNQFSGGIPEEIQFCKLLQDLSVEANHDLDGIIPAVLGQLTSLVFLNLSTCSFKGPLPASFGNLKKLKFLDVSFNNLDGALPKELGNATSLTTLGLAYNEFEGLIPSEFGSLTNLKELVIQNNNLKGVMPQEICTLRQEGILTSITASCDNIDCTCCDGSYCN
ncbi:leucine-rich repeat domain-containing protein [Skeletonema marinoi]|uniref:Leucine-rich repeat domain-containing protein n=1 Tax=Skeletonema marinoi TaxID=267567 RepID=A0AAD8YNN7_9STRA|nr:leucine-rich repeat domain-containing protein [Skeletonema marinoi]